MTAFERLDKWIEKFPNPIFSSILVGTKAQLYYRQKKYQQSLDTFNKAHKAMSASLIKLQSQDSIFDLEIRIAKAKISLGELADAENILQEIKIKSPLLPSLNMAFAELYLIQKNKEKVRESLDKVLVVWHEADKGYVEFNKYLALMKKYEMLL